MKSAVVLGLFGIAALIACVPTPYDGGERLVALDERSEYGRAIVDLTKPKLAVAFKQWKATATRVADFEGAVHLVIAPDGSLVRTVPIPLDDGGIPAEYAYMFQALEGLRFPPTGFEELVSVLLVVRFPAKAPEFPDPSVTRIRDLMHP